MVTPVCLLNRTELCQRPISVLALAINRSFPPELCLGYCRRRGPANKRAWIYSRLPVVQYHLVISVSTRKPPYLSVDGCNSLLPGSVIMFSIYEFSISAPSSKLRRHHWISPYEKELLPSLRRKDATAFSLSISLPLMYVCRQAFNSRPISDTSHCTSSTWMYRYCLLHWPSPMDTLRHFNYYEAEPMRYS